MSYTYDFPQASPCSVVLIYTRDDDKLTLLTTKRANIVGPGRSLSAGGFDEVKDTFDKLNNKFNVKAGELVDGLAETYREMHEELSEGFKAIISYEEFEKRAEYLWDGMVPTEEFPVVHKVVARTLEVSKAEMEAIMALPSTSEQIGKKLEHFDLNFEKDQKVDTSAIFNALTGFKYDHEVQLAAKWYKREQLRAQDRAPTMGPGL